MLNFKTIIATVIMAICGSNAFAQQCCQQGCAEAEALGYHPYPYYFVQAQAGLGTTFTSGKNFFDLTTPTFSVGVGRMFTPVVGARLHFNAFESKSNLKSINETYKYKYVNSNLDVLVNITNLFRKTCHNTLDLYFVGGVGLNYAWDNDEFQTLANTRSSEILEDISNAWGKGTSRKSLLSHNVRAGLLLDVNVCKNLSVGLEADINSLSDRFNSKYNDADDWMLTAQLGVTYKFGHRKAEKPAPVAATPVQDYVETPKAEEAPAKPVVVPEPVKPAPKVEPLHEVIYYEIRMSDPVDETLDKVIAWCNKYPEKSVTVDGYADRGTGNPTINAKYAEARATKVADALKAKGLAADRIIVKSYGDTVQPFAENDKNRCVIIVGK